MADDGRYQEAIAELSPEDLKHAMLAEGMPEGIVERMLDLERYYREDQANRMTNDLKQTTGQEPIRFDKYINDCASFL